MRLPIRSKAAPRHEVKVRAGEGWLTACALLGLKRTKGLMDRWQLTLENVELMLRRMIHPDLLNQGAGRDKDGFFEFYVSEDESIKKLAPLFAQLGFSWSGFEQLIEQEERKDAARKRKRGPLLQHKEFRSLRSWLVDEVGEPGEKLRIALCESSRNDRSRRLKQLRMDSRVVLQALDKTRGDQLKIRRLRGKDSSPAQALAGHSLHQQDRRDEMLVNYEEQLRRELEMHTRQAEDAERAAKEARQAAQRTQWQLDFMTGNNQRRKKRDTKTD